MSHLATGLRTAVLACALASSMAHTAGAVDPAQLAEARAAYQAAFEHYTRLLITPGADGDRKAALQAYREASTRYRTLQSKLEAAGIHPAPTSAASPTLDTQGIRGIVDIDNDASTSDHPSDPRVRLESDAQAGTPRAQMLLGLLLLKGTGERTAPEAGIEWLERAAAGGDPDAMAMLADELDSGLWVAADPQRARTLREQAARLGSALAEWGR